MKSLTNRMLMLSTFFLVSFVTGCGTATVFEPQTSSTEHIVTSTSPTTVVVSSPETALAPSSTRWATATFQVTDATEDLSTSVLTSTPQVNIRLIEKCVTMESSLDFVPEGVIVLRREYSGSGELDLLDLTNGQTRRVVNDKGYVSTTAVSPDYKQLAWIDVKSDLLQIVDATGKDLRSVHVIENWYGVIQWVGQDYLLIESIPLHPDGTLNPPASSVLFNILTSKQEAEYPHGYPDQFFIGNGAPHWGNYYFSQSVFDSSFSRVVYPAYDNMGGALVLRDIERQREIARFRVADPNFGGLPQWNREGSFFISGIYPQAERWDGAVFVNIDDGLPYQGGYDLFRVSRDGEVERLTYLTTQYKAIEEGYSLSPDERKIAFWLVLDYEDLGTKVERQLAILDIDTGKITTLCLAGGDVPYHPVWSPDGEYLVVTVSASNKIPGNPREKSMSEVYLVDLSDGAAVKIAEEAVALGWMMASP
ncbi:hypothetical protein D6779_07000 [Candidatus Parcubacteria bacterium]|nr:MAG: hypothetical protein D6779_07000 [Candidatus Parcubacteria bacterium]